MRISMMQRNRKVLKRCSGGEKIARRLIGLKLRYLAGKVIIRSIVVIE